MTMTTRSQNSALKQSSEIGLLSCFSDSSPTFALELLNELPIPTKAWAYDLGFKDESYIRKLRGKERKIDEELADRIIDSADVTTTHFVRWKLAIDLHRQIKKGLIKRNVQ
jgi:hypothetical protein